VKSLVRYLIVAQVTLLMSAAFDILLFIFLDYHVPSWTLAAMSIAVFLLIEVLKRSVTRRSIREG